MADTVHPRRAQALVGSYAQPRQPSTLRCLTSAEMDAAGFVRNARKFRGEPGRVATYSEIPAQRSTVAMGNPRGTPTMLATRTGALP